MSGPGAASPAEPVRVFCWYALQDAESYQRLQLHLTPLYVSPTELEGVETSPDGKLLVLESELEKHTPEEHARLAHHAAMVGANPPAGFRPLLVTVFAHTIGIVLVALGVYLCYRYAEVILRKLGPTGTGVVVRLTAFILLCIGVQICWNGVHALLMSTFPYLT